MHTPPPRSAPRRPRWPRRLLLAAAIFLPLYIAFVGLIYQRMRQPPAVFARFMAHMPKPVFLLVPFETLWTRARAGPLQVGDPALDFTLQTADRTSTVQLSSFRGARPVVLIFGSYT
jgi:hypothetical protein